MWTAEYYNYCANLIVSSFDHIKNDINIVFGDINYDFGNSNKILKIDIQSEHTLVKLGGRSVDEIIFGNTNLLDGSGKYLIRIPNYEYYSKLDAIIEYSLPNIANIKTNNKFTDYLKKAIYIAPTICKTNFDSKNRAAIITLSNNSSRREVFNLETADLNIKNVQNILRKDDLEQIYNKTKIMVNVHQTDHHHTFEELRVLPALQNGVIIVSEDVPLKEAIPYANSIVWSSYENLAKTVRDVRLNYEDYYKKIFTSTLHEQLEEMSYNNMKNLINFFDNLT